MIRNTDFCFSMDIISRLKSFLPNVRFVVGSRSKVSFGSDVFFLSVQVLGLRIISFKKARRY